MRPLINLKDIDDFQENRYESLGRNMQNQPENWSREIGV